VGETTGGEGGLRMDTAEVETMDVIWTAPDRQWRVVRDDRHEPATLQRLSEDIWSFWQYLPEPLTRALLERPDPAPLTGTSTLAWQQGRRALDIGIGNLKAARHVLSRREALEPPLTLDGTDYVLDEMQLALDAMDLAGTPPWEGPERRLRVALRYAQDALETYRIGREGCECEECGQCGKLARDCTGTKCAETCGCRECDDCHAAGAIAEAEAALALPVWAKDGLELVLREVVAWSIETFPAQTDETRIAHMQRELDELRAAPSSHEEMADVLMLLAVHAAAWMVDLAEATRVKLAAVRERRLAEPDAEGVVEHVR
jgi:hypothetical protein